MAIALFAAAIPFAASSAAADPASLCGPGDTVWFSAAVTGTDGLVSLCGVPSSAGATGWLEFRKGKTGAVEMSYPARRAGSFKAFLYRRYTRPRTTYLKIEFKNDGLTYAILESFDADSAPQSSVSLRTARSSDGTEISSSDLQMLTLPLQMMRLDDHVPTAPYNE